MCAFCTCVCVYACERICTHVCSACMCTRVYPCVYMYACRHRCCVHVCTRVNACVCVHVCVRVCMCVCIKESHWESSSLAAALVAWPGIPRGRTKRPPAGPLSSQDCSQTCRAVPASQAQVTVGSGSRTARGMRRASTKEPEGLSQGRL